MIKNLPRQLNPGGFIKIGVKGKEITSKNGVSFRPPKKLNHFQIVKTQRNEQGDYVIDVDLQNAIKKNESGIVNPDGCLVGIPVRLLYDSTDLNFPHHYISYVNGQLSCRGDGEHSRKRIDNFDIDHPCPCPRIDPAYTGKDKCKISGALTVILDEAGLFGQAHLFRTTSMNTVKGILGGLDLIKAATGGRVSGLPLMLTMNEKQTITPQGIPSTIYIVSICYRGTMADLRTSTLKIMSSEKEFLISRDTIEIEAKKILSLGITVEDPEQEREFVEEFFPENIKDIVNDKKIENAADQAKDITVGMEDVDIEPEEKPEEKSASYNQIKDNDTYKNILEPVGSYKGIYDNFIAEKNLDAAMKFANRLQKGNLLYWLVNTYSDIEFEPNIKKPEALELIKDVLESTLESTPQEEETQTESVEPGSAGKEVVQEDTQEVTESEEPVKYPQEWDNSGWIQKDQLRELVRLKTILEKQGTLQPDKWVDHVKYFLDADGQPISKAVNLTKDQGENFIMMLEVEVKEEEIAA